MNVYSDIIIHQKLSSSAQEQRVLLSYGEQYYEASPAMAELVEELQQHATEEEAIAAYTKMKAGKYKPEQVRVIIDKFITAIWHIHPGIRCKLKSICDRLSVHCPI